MQHNSQYFRYFDWAHLHIQFEIPLVELNVNLFNEIADQVQGGGRLWRRWHRWRRRRRRRGRHWQVPLRLNGAYVTDHVT